MKHHLETCPRDGVVAAVNEAGLAALIFQLEQSLGRAQDLQQQTNVAVVERLSRWKHFEEAVNRVGGLIKRLSYARNMATPKGPIDLQRILAAKQSIEVSDWHYSYYPPGRVDSRLLVVVYFLVVC